MAIHKRVRFSIRYKFLAVSSLLLGICVFTYFIMAKKVFKEDKTELVYDLNRSLVGNLAGDIDTVFRAVSDKLELFAMVTNDKKDTYDKLVEDLVKKDQNIVYLMAYDRTSPMATTQYASESFLETYGLTKNFFSEQLEKHKPIPLTTIIDQGEAIWNATIPAGPPLIGFGRAVIQENANGEVLAHYAVISYIQPAKLINSISSLRLNEIFVANDSGELLIHQNPKFLAKKVNITNWELTKRALSSNLAISVFEYTIDNMTMMGGFAKCYNNKLIVLARVPAAKAFSAMSNLSRQSLVFASIVFTAALIVAIIFAGSLTRPLDTLMTGMQHVANGELSTHIAVHTRDEIATLADSFNAMIRDLKHSRTQLEEINRDLEQKVRERTAKLEEQNQAVKEAQEALLRTTRLAAVGEVAGRAAHEVLNPLTSLITRLEKIQKNIAKNPATEANLLQDICTAWQQDYGAGGFTQLIASWEKPSTILSNANLWHEDLNNLAQISTTLLTNQQQTINDVSFLLKEAHRISKIVQTMRSLSTVKAAKRQHSVHALLHDSANIMADLYNKANVVIREEFMAPQDEALVDRDEFIQSLTNLLRNSLQAVRASNNAPKEVRIITATLNQTIIIDIWDNGVGVTDANKAKLFEAGFSTKNHDEGTGLGLSISRRFIRACGGDIELLSSEPDVATTFRVTLPLKPSTQEVAA